MTTEQDNANWQHAMESMPARIAGTPKAVVRPKQRGRVRTRVRELTRMRYFWFAAGLLVLTGFNLTSTTTSVHIQPNGCVRIHEHRLFGPTRRDVTLCTVVIVPEAQATVSHG